ncbi:hypothetical protein AC579_3056 [Pseudocercospora musae]|uniref:Uncharacterized protein n=1 Tax=Pseudocercospora musae TaxID=113226 RepID=A0A139IJU3_9PEZI|nr:hypothetical protein AC579_3056 [Pseudocercospora musae]
MILSFPDRLPRVDPNGPVGTHKFVLDILWEAATAERLSKPKEGTILFEVGRAFDDMLDKNGSDCLLKAFHKRSSGQMPEERWPCKQHSRGGLPARFKGMFIKIRMMPTQARDDTIPGTQRSCNWLRNSAESGRTDIVKRKLLYALEFKEFLGDVPPYAISSHVWSYEEVSYEDYLKGHEKERYGYQKILELFRIARTGLYHQGLCRISWQT